MGRNGQTIEMARDLPGFFRLCLHRDAMDLNMARTWEVVLDEAHLCCSANECASPCEMCS
jgi:hypothetical protein